MYERGRGQLFFFFFSFFPFPALFCVLCFFLLLMLLLLVFVCFSSFFLPFSRVRFPPPFFLRFFILIFIFIFFAPSYFSSIHSPKNSVPLSLSLSLFPPSTGRGKPQHPAGPRARLRGSLRPRCGVRKKTGGVSGHKTARPSSPRGVLHAVRAKRRRAKVDQAAVRRAGLWMRMKGLGVGRSFTHCCSVCLKSIYGHHIYSKSMDQRGRVAAPARGQPNREN